MTKDELYIAIAKASLLPRDERIATWKALIDKIYLDKQQLETLLSEAQDALVAESDNNAVLANG